jgi:hypothetical protein
MREQNKASIVDCNDNAQMVREGLRNPKLLIDQKVFKKSTAEKELLKELKNRKTPKQAILKTQSLVDLSPVGNLVVYIENTKKEADFKTTRSYRSIKKSEVDGIIFQLSEKKLKVSNHFFKS